MAEPAKRKPCIPVGKLRTDFDEALETIRNLLKEDVTLVDSCTLLRSLAAEVKQKYRACNSLYVALVEKLTSKGCLAESSDYLNIKSELRTDVKLFIEMINKELEHRESDAVSNLDASSVCSGRILNHSNRVLSVNDVNNDDDPVLPENLATLEEPPLHGSHVPTYELRASGASLPPRPTSGPSLPQTHSQWPGMQQSLDPSTQYLAKQELFRMSPNPFMGEPCQFSSWMSLLNIRMASVRLEPLEVVHVLLANTAGEPRRVVEAALHSMMGNPGRCLDEIWARLKQRFGSAVGICASLRKKVDAFPKIRPPKIGVKLQDLADLCSIIQSNMHSNGELQIFNLSMGQRMLFAKFPDALRERWRSCGHDYSSRNFDENPPLSLMIKFLQREASVMQDPKFLISSECEVSHAKDTRVLKTDVDEALCIYHERKGHTVDECKAFLKQPSKEKINFARQKGLCFKCLGEHMSNSCTGNVRCAKCSGGHRTVMHFDNSHLANPRRASSSKTQLCTAVCGDSNQVRSCSKTLLTDIFHPKNPSKRFRCYTILDEQSTSSFIDPTVAHFLGADGPEHVYSLVTMAGYKTEHSGKTIDGLKVIGVNEKREFLLPPLVTSSLIPDNRDEIATPDIVRAHKHVSRFSRKFLELDDDARVMVLIGRDGGDLMKTKCFGRSFPFVHHTPLGWALVGNSCKGKQGGDEKRVFHTGKHQHFSTTLSFPKQTKVRQVANCFDESSDDDEVGPSQNDQQFIERLDASVYVNGNGKITLPLPFVNEDMLLPDNQSAVYCRSRNTLAKLKRDDKTLNQCLLQMKKNIECGHVEMVPKEETKPKIPGRAWWLPMFVVFHPKKKKPRLVFDSSASYHGVSLNSCLLRGPDMGNRLRGVLMRFRLGEVGFVADIESMYYNFCLPPEHVDFLRFYWFLDNDPEKPLTQYRGKVHLFGNKPSPAIAEYGLKYALAHTKMSVAPDVAALIKSNTYVDDSLGSARSAAEAVRVLTEARNILGEFGIRLHKICSNSNNVVESFSESERSEAVLRLDNTQDSIEKTLGISWHLAKDTLFVTANLPQKPFTKRGLLSVTASLYDPLGIVNPVTLRGKKIQRDIMSKAKTEEAPLGWDDPLPLDNVDGWEEWRENLSMVDQVEVKRSFIPPKFGKIVTRELHAFSDASEFAVCAVVYLRLVDDSNQVAVSYVISRSLLIPKSATTIPRAELCAAVEAALLVREVQRELQIPQGDVHMYTDSCVVLGYLNNKEKGFTNYVTRRVYTILKIVKSNQWTYVRSQSNPADVGSRHHTVQSLLASNWIRGPSFLWQAQLSVDKKPEIHLLPELVVCASTKTELMSAPLDIITDRTNSLSRAIRIAACVLSFAFRIVDGAKQRCGVSVAPRDPNVGRDQALRALIRNAQVKHFPTTFAGSVPSRLESLNPFLSTDGLLRVGGRLSNAHLFACQKHPILLPRDHPLTKCIILHFHKETQHQGRHLTHGAIRTNGYHIEKGSKLIKGILEKCVVCRRLRSKLEEQRMSDLPPCRIEDVAPFCNTGVDVFGPFAVLSGRASRRRTGSQKIWALLFTCLASRAVHLEPLFGLDVSSLINAIRRFSSIRGTCKHFYSDNGTNFVCAGKDETVNLRALVGSSDLAGFTWSFTTPHASHHGGAWERKIGAVRKVLECTMTQVRNRLLSHDEFCTLLSESSAIVNNTPLWEVSLSASDPSPITPAMLLTAREHSNPPPIESFDEKDLLSYGRRRWRKAQYLAECFWKQWRDYYLMSQLERSKWRREKRNLSEGDLVLLRDKNVKRNMWPQGVIRSVKRSRDNLVRSVDVEVVVVTAGSVVKKVYRRPICDVVLLISSK